MRLPSFANPRNLVIEDEPELELFLMTFQSQNWQSRLLGGR